MSFPQEAWAAVPAQPNLSAPADGLITNHDTPTFTWARLTGANVPTSYKIQADNSGSGFPSPELDQSVPQPSSGGSVSFTVTSPTLAFGTYTWRVQGINGDGPGPFSSTRTVTVAPSSPTLSSPVNSATTNDQTPTFTWNRVTGATSYQLQVDTSNAGPSSNCFPSVTRGFGYDAPTAINVVVSDPGSGSTVSFTPSTDLADGNYVWHVRSIAGSVNGCYSDERSLTVDDNIAPAAPTLLSPANGAFTNDQTPLLDWQDVTDSSGINRYHIQISTDPTLAGSGSFATPVIDTNVQSPVVSQFTPATDLLPGTYYWHVRARDGGNNFGLFSSIFSFTIDITAPDAPIITPITSPRNTDISTISGTAEAGSSVQVYESGAALDSPVTADGNGAWTLTLGTALGEGSYSFTAIATDAATNPSDPSSPAVEVTVDKTAPDAPIITDPTAGTQNTAISSISGTSGEEGLTITVYDGATSLGTTTSGVGGVWSLTSLNLGDGSHSLTATATDAGGNPSDPSAAVNVIVQTATITIDTSMSLQLSGNSKATPGATFTVSGKLIDAVVDLPIVGKSITLTIDGNSAGAPVTTDNKGMFSVQLTAPTTIGNHDIQAHFGGDSQYNSSDSPIRKLKVEGAAPANTSLSLNLGKNKVNAGSSYSASGSLINEVTKSPIAGMTISVTTDGSSATTAITDSKGKFTVQLTAPNTNGDHNIQAHFAGNSQYNSADSSMSKLTVQGGTLALTTASATDTSLSINLKGKDKMSPGATYTVSGKLVDSASKKPISGKEISVTTDGGSPKGTDTTNSKGEFEVKMKAPDSSAKYDIKAHFEGDSQYKSSDSSGTKITVEDSALKSQQTTSSTDQKQKDDQSSSDSSSSDSSSSDSSSSDSSSSDSSSSDSS
jgi:hypothetical protein